MLTASPFSKLASLTTSLAATALLGYVTTFFLILFVAQLGKLPLAASALATSTTFPITAFLSSFFTAVAMLIAPHKTQYSKEINEILYNALIAGIVILIPCFIIIYFGANILLATGQEPILVKLTYGYFFYFALSLIPFMLYTLFFMFLIGMNRTTLFFITNFLSMLITIILAYGYILGKLGLIPLGLTGYSYTILLVSTLTTAFLAMYLLFHKHYKSFFNRIPHFNLAIFKQIIHFGIPLGLVTTGVMVSISLMVYMVGYISETALASTQIALRYCFLMLCFIAGLSRALSILVSEAYSKNDGILIKRYIKYAHIFLASVFFGMLMLFLLIPGIFINPFMPHQNNNIALLYTQTKWLLNLSSLLAYFIGIGSIYGAILRGLHLPKLQMIVQIPATFLLSLPLAYLIGIYLQQGVIGCFIGYMLGAITNMAILWLQCRRVLQTGQNNRTTR